MQTIVKSKWYKAGARVVNYLYDLDGFEEYKLLLQANVLVPF